MELFPIWDEVKPGGHIIGTKYTLEKFKHAFIIPELTHHDGFEQWEAEGTLDTNDREIRKVRQMLSDYEMPKLDEAINEELSEFVESRVLERPDSVS
ncbi:MAG: trimethylamine methyltransferase family protein [Hyphomicrobiales bacterium]